MTTPALATYALITKTHTDWIEVEHHRLGEDNFLAEILERLHASELTSRNHHRFSVQIQTLQADGTLAVRSVKRCPLCDSYKVPGTRHKCDRRFAPKEGVTVYWVASGATWDPSGAFPEVDMRDADCDFRDHGKSHPGWSHYSQTWSYRVLEVYDTGAEEAWTWKGKTYEAIPSERRVRVSIGVHAISGTVPADTEGLRPAPGVEDYSLDEWRRLAHDKSATA
jgi:hypothetical protein